MGFWSLFAVASMPVLQVLIISVLGAYLASGYSNILTFSATKDMNKIVFTVFTPSLMFASLAKTITLEEIISWWFMPVNIGLIVFLSSFLCWIAVKLVGLPKHLEKVAIAICSAGNFGNLLLILVPAVCNENGGQFGSHSVCSAHGLSYVSFSMALGGFFICTFTWSLVKRAGSLYAQEKFSSGSYPCLIDPETQQFAVDYSIDTNREPLLLPSTKPPEEVAASEASVPRLTSRELDAKEEPLWERILEALYQIGQELMAPPTISSIFGFIFGAVPWLKSLIIGDSAPLRIIEETLALLGRGTIPCITLILGGNLIQGRKHKSIGLKPSLIIATILVNFIVMPIVGIGILKLVGELGFLSSDPLYRYVNLIQYAVPPAMNIVTIAQMFDVGQEECSVILLWNYLASAFATYNLVHSLLVDAEELVCMSERHPTYNIV